MTYKSSGEFSGAALNARAFRNSSNDRSVVRGDPNPTGWRALRPTDALARRLKVLAAGLGGLACVSLASLFLSSNLAILVAAFGVLALVAFSRPAPTRMRGGRAAAEEAAARGFPADDIQ